MRVASLPQSLVVGVAIAWAAPASAQNGTDAARRDLIADAAAASEAGDHARAIELAARAAALRATPSLRYFLAREHLAVGHPVEALALAGECASGARADREVHNREALVARCEAVAAEAERGVARLTVQVPTPAPEGLRVTVAGSVLAPPLYAVDVPVVPGPTEVTASAPGRAPFHATITLAAGARETLAVTLAEPPPPTPPTPGAIVTASLPTPPPQQQPPPRTPGGAGPWVLVGVGALGLVVGGVFGAVSIDAHDSRDAACPSASRCDGGAAERLDARYRDASLGANVAFVVGGVSLAAGLTWWLVARTRSRSPLASLSPAGVVLRW
ncbi:MAG: hypothetical protein EPO40_18605 [Myxococcaceae bacterium]|nr:MAG: hypothetical protein EPO40_18605 [Myxococcaceae bacterium]